MKIQLYSFYCRLLLLLTNKYSHKSLRKLKFTIGSSLLLAVNAQAQNPASSPEELLHEDEFLRKAELTPVPIVEIVEEAYCYLPILTFSHLPEFPGGEENLNKFLAGHLSYPPGCEGIEGKVVVEFMVGKDGTIEAPHILCSLHPLLDAKVLEIVRQMPKWTPGKQNNKPVAVRYTLPVHFKTSE